MGADDLLGRVGRLSTKRGWQFVAKRGKGSHIKVWLNGRRSVIPMHKGDLKPGTFNRIKKDLGLTDADLEEA